MLPPENEPVCGTAFTHTATLVKANGDPEDDPLCMCPLDAATFAEIDVLADFLPPEDDRRALTGGCVEGCEVYMLKNEAWAWLEFKQGVTYEGRTVNQIRAAPRLNQLLRADSENNPYRLRIDAVNDAHPNSLFT